MSKINGKVIQANSGNKSCSSPDLDPHSYVIKGDDGNTYFAHMGDIESNTEKLYKIENPEVLNKNDKVEFEARNNESRAIHIVKIR